jgi:hypothetical protein
VGAVTYAAATSFPGCFAFNASHDFGGCQACDPENGNQDDLAGMGTGCQDRYDAFATSCLANGRVDAQNGSECSFVEGTTTGVVCCQGTASVPAMSPALMLATIVFLLLAGIVAASRRLDATSEPSPRR